MLHHADSRAPLFRGHVPEPVHVELRIQRQVIIGFAIDSDDAEEIRAGGQRLLDLLIRCVGHGVSCEG